MEIHSSTFREWLEPLSQKPIAPPPSPSPPNEITSCTGVYGELQFWVPVNPSLLPPLHFEKSSYVPEHKISFGLRFSSPSHSSLFSIYSLCSLPCQDIICSYPRNRDEFKIDTCKAIIVGGMENAYIRTISTTCSYRVKDKVLHEKTQTNKQTKQEQVGL